MFVFILFLLYIVFTKEMMRHLLFISLSGLVSRARDNF